LVSNGLGGYTERRIAVNTDAAGGSDDENESSAPAAPYVAPPAAVPSGDLYRSAVGWGQTQAGGALHDVHVADAVVYVQDTFTGTIYPKTGPVISDYRGEFVIPALPPGNAYATFCLPVGTTVPTFCSAGFYFLNDLLMPAVATTDYLSSFPGGDPNQALISGNLVLSDGSTCGTFNEFFGVHSTATATLLDSAGHIMGLPVRLNELGD
jgi:hypothetical protein